MIAGTVVAGLNNVWLKDRKKRPIKRHLEILMQIKYCYFFDSFSGM